LDRLAQQINQHMVAFNAAEAAKASAIRQRIELQEGLRQIQPRIAQLTRIAKELSKHIELTLSAQFSNRQVNLIGGDLQNLKD